MPKRVLITGASGFVGANVARRALRDGHEVHLLLRPGHQPWRLAEIISHIHFHEAELADREAVRSAVSSIRPDWIFHLAAYGAYSYQIDSETMVATNILGSMHLLDACAELEFDAFVNCGSSSEYGIKNSPTAEDNVLEPNSVYAVTKAAATHYCQFISRARNLNCITARLYSIYGPWEEPTRLIPTLIEHCLRGVLPPLVRPETARDFVYVDDAVNALFVMASARTVPRGSVYNVSSGVQTTLRDVVELARDLMNVAAEPVWATMPQRSWDTSVWVGLPEKLGQATGWRAQTSLAEGLRSTVEFMRAHPELYGAPTNPSL